MPLEIFIGNTNIARLDGVRSDITGEFDDTANIVFTLLDSAGAEVPGQIWPTQMFNEPGGIYACNIMDTVQILLNHTYICVVDGLGTNGEVMAIRQEAIAKVRGGAC